MQGRVTKELEPFDGGAKAIMDDVYVFGPAAQVFPAIERFVSALRRLTGLQINQGKSACFSRGYAARAARRARSAGPAETELHGLLSHGSC